MNDLKVIIENLALYVPSFQDLLGAIAFLCGVGMVFLGIYRMAARSNGDPRQRTYTGALANIMAGSVLIALPSLITVLNLSFWNTPEVADASSIFAYAPTVFDPNDQTTVRFIEACVRLIQFLGLIALFRGILLLNDHVQASMGGQSKLGPGLTFIFAGAMAVNFPKFVSLLDELM